MSTVGEVLKRIQQIKKDMEYVASLQEKWREQKDRFPKIYEGIQAQAKYFQDKIEEMKNLKVEGLIALFDLPARSKGEAPTISPPKAGEDTERSRRGRPVAAAASSEADASAKEPAPLPEPPAPEADATAPEADAAKKDEPAPKGEKPAAPTGATPDPDKGERVKIRL